MVTILYVATLPLMNISQISYLLPSAPNLVLTICSSVAPLETIGLFGFAWTSLGPDYGIPWIAPMIFTVMIAIANYGIYKVRRVNAPSLKTRLIRAFAVLD